MEFYDVTKSIDASPQAIWEVLTDGPGFTSWDSGIVRFEGTIAAGNKVKLFSEVSPNRAFPLKVTELSPPRKMVFKGGMPLGLFTGVRSYTLEPEAGGGTRFHMREEYTGPLLRMIWKSMPDLGPSFEKFASGLKARAEKG
ncbi:MAG: SRPBCC domain-containing protein [Acidimicrobiia bacterium]|nr:SRPBCC domain-containing protein [Acidimicrobiia bacterium]NNC93659.1 SRPBCC domain-containing protein [Acidimicrobiia bacterium]